jgi:hypothetical protein
METLRFDDLPDNSLARWMICHIVNPEILGSMTPGDFSVEFKINGYDVPFEPTMNSLDAHMDKAIKQEAFRLFTSTAKSSDVRDELATLAELHEDKKQELDEDYEKKRKKIIVASLSKRYNG